MLGFSLKSDEDQLALVDVAGKAKKGRSVTTDEVVFVHCCCEKGNIMSKPIEGQGVKITDITNEDDFTNVNTVKDVLKKIKGPGDISFIAHHALVGHRGND